MIGKLDDREAQFEAAMERYVSGLKRLGPRLKSRLRQSFAKAMDGYLTGVPRRDRRDASFDFRW